MIVVGVIGITCGPSDLLGGRLVFFGNQTIIKTAIHISNARSNPTVIERPSTTGSVGIGVGGLVFVVVVSEAEVVEVVVVVVGLAAVVVVVEVVVDLAVLVIVVVVGSGKQAENSTQSKL